ncbi:uncharacterized protein TRAVEDRAFT_31515 [Trametes versicolor FP-101664 SS1]|uniref:uncharacterized protein n=1 Tax=Trametes versicolor (strain FP-101664) TaxID=717944 RepID=UPI0004622E08|nr:uncharacterized protein TRAVEDRAFT_31515 [Trametes versicolor FP-101664 SS1]EIW53308.1 hypothetical protein TRAVEDRAFT_31515 [Trametes versicolor FP-101664 SS1]
MRTRARWPARVGGTRGTRLFRGPLFALSTLLPRTSAGQALPDARRAPYASDGVLTPGRRQANADCLEIRRGLAHMRRADRRHYGQSACRDSERSPSRTSAWRWTASRSAATQNETSS